MISKEDGSGRSYEAPVQSEIESAMRIFYDEQRWESIFLFSSEGFMMAGCGASDSYKRDHLLEFQFSLIQLLELLGDELPVKEVIIRGKDRKILAFRHFQAWDEDFMLAAIIGGRKGYRRAMGQLIKRIQSLG